MRGVGRMKSPYTDSLAHITWECKYHIVFAPKFRRKEIYGKLKQEIGVNVNTKMYNFSNLLMHKIVHF